MGGAEKVHYQIVQAIAKSKNCKIFFTRKSNNIGFLEEFKKSGFNIKDISTFTDNKWLYFLNFIYRGVISNQINTQSKKCLVFNGQSNFGYKISPWINKKLQQFELIHALNSFSFIRIPFLEFYYKSITVSENIIKLHETAYEKLEVPKWAFENFIFIESKIKIVHTNYRIDFKEAFLQILYVGRDSYEKRPFIVAKIAEKLKDYKHIKFNFIGDVKKSIDKNLHQYCNFIGEINSEELLMSEFKKNHIVVIPSSTESGPLVLLEAMSVGCVIISTPVGYVKKYILNEINGFVTKNIDHENNLIEEFANIIIKCDENRQFLKEISKKNVEFAEQNFDISIFNEQYKSLLS